MRNKINAHAHCLIAWLALTTACQEPAHEVGSSGTEQEDAPAGGESTRPPRADAMVDVDAGGEHDAGHDGATTQTDVDAGRDAENPDDNRGGGDASQGGEGGRSDAMAPFPLPQVALEGEREQWNGYSFIPPPGMYLEQDESVLLLLSSTSSCFINLLKPTAADIDPVAQSRSVAAAAFPDATGFNDRGHNEVSAVSAGVSGAGWRYTSMSAEVELASLRLTGIFVNVTLVQLAEQVFPVLAVEHQDDECLGIVPVPSRAGWALFFHSLSFPGHEGEAPEALAAELFGRWRISVNDMTDLAHVYTVNHRYNTAVTVDTAQELSGTGLVTFWGSGAFVVEQNRLGFLPDDGRDPHSVYFRIEIEPNIIRQLPVMHQLIAGPDGTPMEFELIKME